MREGAAIAFRVALTFDAEHPDRPTEPGVVERILDLLADARVPSTFFVQGRWAESAAPTARRIADEGHLVGNHSFYHARLPLLSPRGLARDVRAAERVILEVTGHDPRPWFRCPFGAGARSKRIHARLAALGYRDVGWDVNTRDWAGSTPARLAARVTRETVAHGDGAVVLFHSWPAPTAAALPAIVDGLRAHGASFVRVDAL